MVGIIMGSYSDWEWVKPCHEILIRFGIACEVKVVSAHRSPELMFEYAKSAKSRGIKLIIAAAGGSAHLPGMVASLCTLPVVAIPVPSKHLSGVDSLLSIVQMPPGVPVATVGIGNAINAALLAIRILALTNQEIEKKLEAHFQSLREEVKKMQLMLEDSLKEL
ncbi:MAG: 5-(carboxyamino)imidazole ribonucleotide mutase [Aquificaceae bacterium]